MSDPTKTTLLLHGCWYGPVTDTTREFRGVVRGESTHPVLASGTNVTVLYHAAASRVPGAGQHGTYALRAGGQDFKLMRLSLHPSRAGGAVHDDTQPADWEADVINEH